MTRQVALGAIVAFGLTVLVLSVWTPSAPVISAAPTPVPVAAPAPSMQGEKPPLKVMPIRDLKPGLMGQAVFARTGVTAGGALELGDAGAP